MSTRHARLADKELNDKHTRILVELLQRAENKTCADCRRKDPRWASWNLGIFICIRCSGSHRSLGTHISKVKSVDLDTWIPEQIENMIKLGNQHANIYWEANLNGGQPNENNMDVWIRAKYEQKQWVEKVGIMPDPSQIEKKEDTLKTTIKAEKPTPIRDPSKEFGLLYHNSSLNSKREKEPSTPAAKISPVATKSNQIINQTNATSTVPKKTVVPVTTANSGFKIDMSSFQAQLSGLSMGRPSSGLIPQAPPGSDTSWANFLVTRSTSNFESDTTLSQPSTEKPLIPYDAFASLRR